MITTARHLPIPPAAPQMRPPLAPLRPMAAPPPPGYWRYACPRRSRLTVVVAVLVSVSIHAVILFGLSGRKKRVAPPPAKNLIALTFAIPKLEELDEPEPTPTDEAPAKADLGEPAPMQADLPQIPTPTDFVQQIDFSSLVERPDLSNAKLWTIPENIRRGGKSGEGLANIFNLADLDRVPVAVMQPAPVYPIAMRQLGASARVMVEFIVDVEGRVQNAVATQSTYPGFDEAAVLGVQKWRFRPGVRGGKKVNTRMSVPILFTVADSI